MSSDITELTTIEVFYPESDGKPMAENTRQYRYIVLTVEGINALFRNDPDVFVAGDLFWYPVEGHPEIVQAPDAMVAFGRPKGDRGSYQQWREGNVAPQVVFEILSPSNFGPEMRDKRSFYEQYGVEEYYVYDPDRGKLEGWQRQQGQLRQISSMQGWISPRLNVRFQLVNGELELYRPDGAPFIRLDEALEQVAMQQRQAAIERQRAETERERAETERERADAEQRRADAERQRNERLAERLRQLGENPDVL